MFRLFFAALIFVPLHGGPTSAGPASTEGIQTLVNSGGSFPFFMGQSCYSKNLLPHRLSCPKLVLNRIFDAMNTPYAAFDDGLSPAQRCHIGETVNYLVSGKKLTSAEELGDLFESHPEIQTVSGKTPSWVSGFDLHSCAQFSDEKQKQKRIFNQVEAKTHQEAQGKLRKLATGMYYYYGHRLSQGASQIVDELAQIDSLLEDQGRFRDPHSKKLYSPLSSCQKLPAENFPRVKQRCEQYQSCQANGGITELAAQTQASLEALEKLDDRISELQLQVSTPSDAPVEEIGQELTVLRERVNAIKALNPWIDAQSIRTPFLLEVIPAIKKYLQNRRREKLAEFDEFKNADSCLNHSHEVSGSLGARCEKFYSTLKKTPRFSHQGFSSSQDDSHQAVQHYFNTAECLDDMVESRDQIDRQAVEFLADVGITVVSGGLGLASHFTKGARTLAVLNRAAKAVDAGDFAWGLQSSIEVCRSALDPLVQATESVSSHVVCPGKEDAPRAQAAKDFRACLLSALVTVGPNVARLTPAATRALQRKATSSSLETLDDWLKQNRRFDSQSITIDNARYIASVDPQHPLLRGQSVQGEKASLFFNTELAITKQLNDKIIRDKSIVDAMTRSYKNAFADAAERVILPDGRRLSEVVGSGYNDYKSLRLILTEDSPSIRKALREAHMIASNRFAREVRGVPELRTKIEDSQDDFIREPGNWFFAGIGESADQANAAARSARQQAINGETFVDYAPLQVGVFRNGQELMRQALSRIDGHQKQFRKISAQKGKSAIFVTEKNGSMGLDLEVIEILRKVRANNRSEYIAQVRKQIEERFPEMKRLTDQEVIQIRDYYRDIEDYFSASVYQIERTSIDLSQGKNGVVSVDFAGLGARNFQETAREVLSNSGDVDAAIRSSRRAEETVTRQMEKMKKHFFEVVRNFEKKWISDPKLLEGVDKRIKFSGDDGIYFPPQALSPEAQQALFDALSQTGKEGNRKQFRVGFLEASSQASTRLVVGEGFEKSLRAELYRLGVRRKQQREMGLAFRYVSGGGRLPDRIELMVSSQNPVTEQVLDQIRQGIQNVRASTPALREIEVKLPSSR